MAAIDGQTASWIDAEVVLMARCSCVWQHPHLAARAAGAVLCLADAADSSAGAPAPLMRMLPLAMLLPMRHCFLAPTRAAVERGGWAERAVRRDRLLVPGAAQRPLQERATIANAAACAPLGWERLTWLVAVRCRSNASALLSASMRLHGRGRASEPDAALRGTAFNLFRSLFKITPIVSWRSIQSFLQGHCSVRQISI